MAFRPTPPHPQTPTQPPPTTPPSLHYSSSPVVPSPRPSNSTTPQNVPNFPNSIVSSTYVPDSERDRYLVRQSVMINSGQLASPPRQTAQVPPPVHYTHQNFPYGRQQPQIQVPTNRSQHNSSSSEYDVPAASEASSTTAGQSCRLVQSNPIYAASTVGANTSAPAPVATTVSIVTPAVATAVNSQFYGIHGVTLSHSSRNSSCGIQVTPSPSDSGVAELEVKQRKK